MEVAHSVFDNYKVPLNYKVGVMIELPRAALNASSIARRADFFSFGTNDLTQTTLGMSRDDADKFLYTYKENGIIKVDPFVSIDIEGVGELMQIACERARVTKPGISLGVCGELGERSNFNGIFQQNRCKLCFLFALQNTSCEDSRRSICTTHGKGHRIIMMKWM